MRHVPLGWPSHLARCLSKSVAARRQRTRHAQLPSRLPCRQPRRCAPSTGWKSCCWITWAAKDKPYWYIDTHAGAGAYALDSAYASKNAEYNTGIGRLWTRDDLPPSLADYVALVKLSILMASCAPTRFANGGAAPAARQRPHAPVRAASTDHGLLAENFAHAQRQTRIEHADGFDGVKAILPPPPRRALMLIDPL